MGLVLTVLIGPPGAGKSTLGIRAAELTFRPFVDADEAAAASYARVGWSVERLLRRAEEIGYETAHAEWEPALARAVQDLVTSNRDAVLALGAGHSHVTDPALFDSVADALATAEQVVLLRPDPDPSSSLLELRQRCMFSKGRDWTVDGVDWLQRWLSDGRDDRLATSIVYTAGRSVEESVSAVLAAPIRDHHEGRRSTAPTLKRAVPPSPT